MNHLTETGAYRAISASPKARSGSSISQSIIQNLNRPMPWVVILALCLVWMTWIAAKSESKADAANQRITDFIAAQAQIQSAAEQTMNDTRNRAIDAEIAAQLARSHIDELHLTMQRAGIKPPAIPERLKTLR